MTKPLPLCALVVEDDALIALATELVLRSEGFEQIERCPSAQRAITLLSDLSPHLMVIDAGLSDREDGWSIAELARETIVPMPQMLFVTGRPDAIPEDVARLGRVLPKPCSEEELRRAIREAMD